MLRLIPKLGITDIMDMVDITDIPTDMVDTMDTLDTDTMDGANRYSSWAQDQRFFLEKYNFDCFFVNLLTLYYLYCFQSCVFVVLNKNDQTDQKDAC